VNRRVPFWRRFNWRILLLRLLINAAALLLTAALVPSIYFVDRSVRTVLLMALALGLLNAFVKPILQVLTLHFIFASYGLIVILINAFMLFLLSYFFPLRFAVDKLFWTLVGGALIGLLGSLLESLLGVAPPIVGDAHPDIRAKVKAQQYQVNRVEAKLVQPLSGPAPESPAQVADIEAVEVAETPFEAGSNELAAQTAEGGEA
jgi:putative membrane protein